MCVQILFAWSTFYSQGMVDRFKDTEGMLSRWLHSLQELAEPIIHSGNSDGRIITCSIVAV